MTSRRYSWDALIGESTEKFEDELHLLLSLPGPKIRKNIVQKIQGLARQIEAINLEFLETKLPARVIVINIFALPNDDVPELQLPSSTTADQTTAVASNVEDGVGQHTENGLSSDDLSEGEDKDNNDQDTLMVPFSRYTVTMFHTFERAGRWSQRQVDHLGLVRGTEGLEDDDSWISEVADLFNDGGFRK